MWADLIGSFELPGEEKDCITCESRHKSSICGCESCRSCSVCCQRGCQQAAHQPALGHWGKVGYEILLLLEIRAQHHPLFGRKVLGILFYPILPFHACNCILSFLIPRIKLSWWWVLLIPVSEPQIIHSILSSGCFPPRSRGFWCSFPSNMGHKF